LEKPGENKIKQKSKVMTVKTRLLGRWEDRETGTKERDKKEQ
jgi:hypothetical protein